MIDPSSSEEEGDDEPVIVALPKGRPVMITSSTSTSKSNLATTNADSNVSSFKLNGEHFQTSSHKSIGASANGFESGSASVAISGNGKLEHSTHTIVGSDASGNLEVPSSAIPRSTPHNNSFQL
ncbi:calcium-dependent secretion activator-like [Anastrepha obliqua]|uniref:calcium-dependent secretion activator-like n=1 Tax=Anastrepha obliqua TaxID=95512 RepID=UPI002409B330|nr:calcium-dependent secretion activator-like [Anastrepha obliqua]